MLRYVDQPNLPQGRVRAVFVGENTRKTILWEKYGIQPIYVSDSALLDAPVKSHVDMQVVHLYRDKFISHKDEKCKVRSLYSQEKKNKEESACKVSELVEQISWMTGDSVLSPDYPKCAAYNVLLLDKLAVFNPKCIDSFVKSQLDQMGLVQVPVRQGFARCSVCVVNASAVITADHGIANALRTHGVSVLEIQPGYIELPGYNYGFIGGATFLLSPNRLAFTGSIRHHPDYDRIIAFLNKHDVEPVYLTNQPIFDIGSAIPVIEESLPDEVVWGK